MNISHDPWVLGDGRFFWDLRPARYWSARLCVLTSLFGNAVLVYLIKMEKNSVMIPYSRVLLMNVGFDLFYTFICVLTEVEEDEDELPNEVKTMVEIEMNDGQYFLILNGPAKHLSVVGQIAAIGIWEWSISAVCHVSAVEFVFRYFRVCKNYTMSYKWLAVSALIVTLCSVVNTSFLCSSIASFADHNATFGHLMTDPMWLEKDGSRATFVVASMDTTYLRMFITSVCICDVGITSVLTLSSVATLRALAQQQHLMSAKVKYMQAQLNKLMLAEFISLTSVFAIPIGALLIFLFLRIQWVGFGIIVAICIEWIPAVNPATTIFMVGSYRNALIGMVKQRLFGEYASSSSVHPTDPPATSTQGLSIALP